MEILLYPPVAFVISLFAAYLFAAFFSSWAVKPASDPEKTKTYACGEDFPAEKVIPNYEEFYPFAIFFTVLHVAGLMLATMASASAISFVVPFIYIFLIGIVLTVLFIR